MRNLRNTGFAAAAIAVSMVAAGSFSVAESTGEGMVKYRQSVMGAVGGHMGAIVRIVRGEADLGDQLLAHAEALHDLSLMIPDAFQEISAEGVETRALPEIWTDWDGFTAKVDAFQTASADLVAAVESGDQEAIAAAFGPVGGSCKGCHDDYRGE